MPRVDRGPCSFDGVEAVPHDEIAIRPASPLSGSAISFISFWFLILFHDPQISLTAINDSCDRGWDRFAVSVLFDQHGGSAMKGFVDDIEKLTEGNGDFRRVLYTGKNLQLVLMAIEPGGEIGAEVHDDGDQFFRVESGSAEILIDDVVSEVKAGMAMIVPAGARHNVRNSGAEPLKLYTVYAPPAHHHATVHVTKADADASHEHFDGVTSE
ncbi:MAG: cupin domain-containing protein [Desulfomicrobium sp.]|nr:cupin domain-containing protein [Desulfomicrobium sp.]